MESIAKLFKKPVDVTPEELGAALHELTLESFEDRVHAVGREPSLLGGIERATFFSELMGLLACAVDAAAAARLADVAVRERVHAAFLARHEEFRRGFKDPMLDAPALDARAREYAAFARESGSSRPPMGVAFAKRCGVPSPMAAHTATQAYEQIAEAAAQMLANARLG